MDTNTRAARSAVGEDVVLVRGCPSRAVLEVLSNKWTTLVMCALGGGELRFGQLRRRVEGVTQKMLTQTLRSLERDGLVTRRVYPTAPPSVGYTLTELGRSAAELHDAIVAWALQHADDILASRAAYDDRARLGPYGNSGALSGGVPAAR